MYMRVKKLIISEELLFCVWDQLRLTQPLMKLCVIYSYANRYNSGDVAVLDKVQAIRV